MRWRRSDLPGALAATAVAVAAMMATAFPSFLVRAGLTALTPLVVLAVFLSSMQAGACRVCHAPRRAQTRRALEPVVRPAGRTELRDGSGFGVSTGWEIDLPVEVSCQRCGLVERSTTTRYVPRSAASTPSQALTRVLVSDE